jgi:Dolichyl-phosphate-mannose-protein mannosyltransferase
LHRGTVKIGINARATMNVQSPMTSAGMEQCYLGQQSLIKSVLLFFAAFALYFFTHSPALDEIDAVQFAMGVRLFDVWHHQPHPPGYLLFIFLGWLGTKLFHTGPESSLYCVSALGGGLFIAAWFSIIRVQFSERLAWWVAISLLITPIVWMTATKALTDTLAAGFVSAELLAGICFLKQKRSGLLVLAALMGAAAAGTRPQLFPVVALILGIPLKKGSATAKTWCFSYTLLLAGCLIWLFPMWYIQAQLRPSEAFWRVYPELVYSQWRWRLDRPSVYIGAGDWSPRYLAIRLAEHILGWFGLGFGFLQSPAVLVLGAVIALFGLVTYLFSRRGLEDRNFWQFHTPWALLHITIIFVCLGGKQRYYLIIYPLLLVALMRAFLQIRTPWNWSALALPALLLYITIPAAIQNHREEAPPVRLVRYLEQLYPPPQRKNVVLLFVNVWRNAERYAAEFKTFRDIPPPGELPEVLKGAAAVYTDDAKAPLPEGWRRVPLATFQRSIIIHAKHRSLTLFLIDRHS